MPFCHHARAIVALLSLATTTSTMVMVAMRMIRVLISLIAVATIVVTLCVMQLGHTHRQSDPGVTLTLVVEGAALSHALENHSATFSELALMCDSVICCRATPVQKAKLVAVVRAAGALPYLFLCGRRRQCVSRVWWCERG